MSQKISSLNIRPLKRGVESGLTLEESALQVLSDNILETTGETPTANRTTLYTELRKAGDSEILNFVEKRLGLRIPRKQICKEHNAPAEFFLKAFREEELDLLVLANRSGSKTTLSSVLSFLDSINYRDCETFCVGGSERQAQRAYQYTKEFWDRDSEFADLLLKEPMISETILRNGSTIRVLAGSTKAVHGPHGQRLKGDEIEEMDYDVFQGMLSIPETTHGIEASTILMSTRHKPFGIMEQLIGEYRERGYSFYSWCYKEIAAKCPYSCMRYNGPAAGVYAKCPLWDSCQGVLKHASGYYAVRNIIGKYLKLDRETWISQWECKKPESQGMVFDEANMIENPDLQFNKNAATHIGIDPGFSAPACYLLIQEVGEEIHVLDELYLQYKTDPELLDELEIFEGSSKPAGRAADFEDPGLIAYFNDHKKPTVGVAFKKNKKEAIKERRNFYRQKRIVVNSRKCKRFLREEKGLHYVRDNQNKPTEEIAKGNDHGPDALTAYFIRRLQRFKTDGGGSIRISTLSDIRRERDQARAEAEALAAASKDGGGS